MQAQCICMLRACHPLLQDWHWCRHHAEGVLVATPMRVCLHGVHAPCVPTHPIAANLPWH